MPDTIARLNAALGGRYRIVRELGEGGMAIVYLADDLKHQRKVALKVLRPELAAVVGAERFLAEIKTTASLQHPHILPLFDSGEADGFLFFVMPHVEGETLRDRLDRDKQLPVDEALAVATAVAHALQAAHDHGVVHRDIKPANILLSQGEPLVADFGIALAVREGVGHRLTETGLSVGTPHYMSPEQATGDQAVGPATDIYSLGCVLYEMLVGEPPYLGTTAQAILGKIIQGNPVSATAARSTVPRNVDAAIRRALEKLPADRFTSPRDFARALADPLFRHGGDVAAGVEVSGRRWKRVALAASASTMALAIALGTLLLGADPPSPVTRVAVDFAEGQQPAGSGRGELSADGSLLVYLGPSSEGTAQLWARRWDVLDAIPLRDTEQPSGHSISPDGSEVALTRGGGLRVVPVAGGVSRTVVQDSVRCCTRWSPDGQWVYYSRVGAGIARVPSLGGTVEPVTEVDRSTDDTLHVAVEVLPSGNAVVFEASSGPQEESPRLYVLRLGSGEPRELTTGRFPRFARGHLLFTDAPGTTLLAAPFDVRRLELTAPPRPIVEGLRPAQGPYAYFSVSQTGALYYSSARGLAGDSDTELVWATRSGAMTPVGWLFRRGDANYSWRLSPDGTTVALRAATEGNYDIWVKELPDRPPRRLTFDQGIEWAPWWSADGRSVNYTTTERDVWVVPADGTGAPELFIDAERPFRQGDWSPDGRWLVLRTAAQETGPIDQPDRDLLAFRPGVDTQPTPLVATTEFAENGPAISPDGMWLAYASTETGRYEIWVRPFPDVERAKYQVSSGGGFQPRWARSGRELFYLTPERALVSARYESEPSFRVVASETLFTLPVGILAGPGADSYDVALDDQRFIMGRNLAAALSEATDHILAINAFEELRAR
jgi:serine/threonine-protein kinase